MNTTSLPSPTVLTEARREFVDAKNKRVCKVGIGDIFYSSWGYDQTNIDWYQVVGFVGQSSIKLRPLHEVRKYDAPMMGSSIPVRDSFSGDAFTKRVKTNGTQPWIRLTSFSGAFIWDGAEKNFTEYA